MGEPAFAGRKETRLRKRLARIIRFTAMFRVTPLLLAARAPALRQHAPLLMKTLGVAIIGCGGITLQNHLPGLALCAETQRRRALRHQSGDARKGQPRHRASTSPPRTTRRSCARDDVQAVIIATPNVAHGPIAHAAIAAGKHVLCEKPIAMNYAEAKAMAEAADAAGVRHMTAFTYRFVPAMRYLGHLIAQGDLGQPYHYRSCRLQDWGTRNLGWRQVKALAGTGELGDMLSHRIDFAQHLVGPMQRLVANTKRLVDDARRHSPAISTTGWRSSRSFTTARPACSKARSWPAAATKAGAASTAWSSTAARHVRIHHGQME